MTTAVEEYIAAKIWPEQKPLVERLRVLVRECAPNAAELITYGIIGWKGRKMLAVISPTQKDMTFSFSQGAAFEDRFGLLKGEGHVSKHIKVTDVDTLPEEAIRYYIAQALKLDEA